MVAFRGVSPMYFFDAAEADRDGWAQVPAA
jgi:hypothetical protein